MAALKARAAMALASAGAAAITRPSRMTLSARITVPGRDSGTTNPRVLDVAGLVGVDEHEVEGPLPSGRHLSERHRGRADPHLDTHARHRAPDAATRDGRVVVADFEADDHAAGWQGAGEPRGAVAAQGADLQDPLGPRHLRQEVDQPALVGRDVDGRQTGRLGVRQVPGERGSSLPKSDAM